MGRTKGPRKISRYTAEFKVKAVKLSEVSGAAERQAVRRHVGHVHGDPPLHSEAAETG